MTRIEEQMILGMAIECPDAQLRNVLSVEEKLFILLQVGEAGMMRDFLSYVATSNDERLQDFVAYYINVANLTKNRMQALGLWD